MAAAIGIITYGGLLIVSGIKGISILDLLSGAVHGTLNPKGGRREYAATDTSITPAPAGAGNPIGDVSGSPKDIIDKVILPIAASHGIHRTAAANTLANATHGPTVTGTPSDHQGPPTVAWAADMSNGSSPTPQMDALAADLASKFAIPWNGSGLAERTSDGYRYQLIYRTTIGGNHFNHVHFGIRKV